MLTENTSVYSWAKMLALAKYVDPFAAAIECATRVCPVTLVCPDKRGIDTGHKAMGVMPGVNMLGDPTNTFRITGRGHPSSLPSPIQRPFRHSLAASVQFAAARTCARG